MLLPIKTKNGIIEKRLILENDIEDNNTSEKEHDAEDNIEIESNLHVRLHQTL